MCKFNYFFLKFSYYGQYFKDKRNGYGFYMNTAMQQMYNQSFINKIPREFGRYENGYPIGEHIYFEK